MTKEEKYILKVDQNGNMAEDCFTYELKQLFDKYGIKHIQHGFIGYDDENNFDIKGCTIEGSANGIFYFNNDILLESKE